MGPSFLPSNDLLGRERFFPFKMGMSSYISTADKLLTHQPGNGGTINSCPKVIFNTNIP